MQLQLQFKRVKIYDSIIANEVVELKKKNCELVPMVTFVKK